jgi:uncharacterized protein
MHHQDSTLNRKYQRLVDLVKSLNRVVVAFSGGVDSTFMLKVAADVLKENVLAVTALSDTFPQHERKNAERLAKEMGIAHLCVETREMKMPAFVNNPSNKCYICKHHRFGLLVELARTRGFDVVVDGENADDCQDYRPGWRAARQWGVKSPLNDAGLNKADIRRLSKKMGLPTWNTPASACLASRIPYHQIITKEKLKQVESAEMFLRQLGMSGQVRVRLDKGLACIEVDPGEISRLAEETMRKKVLERFIALGFKGVFLDLGGYTMGSLNRDLPQIAETSGGSTH